MGLLRIILAIAVLVAHSGNLFGLKLTGGTVAVEVFFIISGFYMTMILDKKYTGKGSYYLFLSNLLDGNTFDCICINYRNIYIRKMGWSGTLC